MESGPFLPLTPPPNVVGLGQIHPNKPRGQVQGRGQIQASSRGGPKTPHFAVKKGSHFKTNRPRGQLRGGGKFRQKGKQGGNGPTTWGGNAHQGGEGFGLKGGKRLLVFTPQSPPPLRAWVGSGQIFLNKYFMGTTRKKYPPLRRRLSHFFFAISPSVSVRVLNNFWRQ